jgi:hypothetical protein
LAAVAVDDLITDDPDASEILTRITEERIVAVTNQAAALAYNDALQNAAQRLADALNTLREMASGGSAAVELKTELEYVDVRNLETWKTAVDGLVQGSVDNENWINVFTAERTHFGYAGAGDRRSVYFRRRGGLPEDALPQVDIRIRGNTL